MAEGTMPAVPVVNDEIGLTAKAAEQVRRLKADNNIPEAHGLRLGVKGGGCSGLSYVLAFDDAPRENDKVLEIEGIKVFIDPKSLFYLSGTVLDFSDGLNGKGFVFKRSMDSLAVLFRWLHIVAGILWIGLLYWFNFVNGPFAGTMDGETKKRVVPELMPRALYWFRWGAAYTWVTGLLLLLLVYYHGGLMFEPDNATGWGAGAIIMLVVTLGIFGFYDALAKSKIGKNIAIFAVVGFVLTAAIIWLMINVGGYSYRAYVIHAGAMFGTIMAANVWMRIYPSQKKIINAIKSGAAPDPDLVALAGTRSRHNTFLSVPLVWTMINAHTTVPGADSWLYLLVAILLGWLLVSFAYTKAPKVKGF
jgi:iron-sulfur cluster assembly accessory protein